MEVELKNEVVMLIRNYFRVLVVLIITVNLISCTQKNKDSKIVKTEVNKAICLLYPTQGSETMGKVTFSQKADGMLIIADVKGLSPGKHGFHIHEYGDCSQPDGKSAGGHFNPTSKNHGGPNSEDRHVGDLGNLIAKDDGTAYYEWTDKLLSFSGPKSILGRAIIVHADEDDLISQPTGNAGARIACGVIGTAN
jgi:Cu-Zn family superoxide dismutase